MTAAPLAPAAPAVHAPQLRLEFDHWYPAPLPRDLHHENIALLGQYLNSWTLAFGELNHQEDGDFEHFVENMARFDAASRAFGFSNTTILHTAGPHLYSLCEFNGAPVLPDEEVLRPAPDFTFGPVPSWGERHRPEEALVDRYWEIPAFRALAGRWCQLAGFLPDDADAPDLLAVLQSMFDDGVRRFVVKGTAPKTLLVDFTLSVRPTSLFGAASEVPSELTDAVMHLEGRSDVFLVQEHVPMTHEYRVFMAGDGPAAGAGCIEHLTPLDSRGSAFDVRTEAKRGSGEVVEDSALIERFRTFAAGAGALLHGHAPELGSAWVMDLAVNAETGQIVIIELNGARNAGLYASSPGAWMGAVRDWLAG